jgi:hypothetical protein
LSRITAVEQVALAKHLPDIPRFVETRAMLLADQCEVFGLESEVSSNFVLRHNDVGTISVIGQPAAEAILQAVEPDDGDGDVLAFEDNYAYVKTVLPQWSSEKAALHRLGDSPMLPNVPDGMVRFLRPGEVSSLTDLSEELAEELALAARLTQIAATIVDGQPVSFCYAGSITETLWDISIDTIEGFRQRGLAAFCVAFMIDYFNGQGKEPVWGAFLSNSASMNLAAKLGFVPVDELYVFER